MDVTVDLAAMSLIDSTGVSVLVSGLKRLRDTGGDLAIQLPRASALKVLEITGLTGVFTIHSEAASDTSSNGAHEIQPEDAQKSKVVSSRTSSSRAESDRPGPSWPWRHLRSKVSASGDRGKVEEGPLSRTAAVLEASIELAS